MKDYAPLIPADDLPPGIRAQALRVLELRDAAEVAKQRAELALEILLSRMAKAELRTFRIRPPEGGEVVEFFLDQRDPQVKLRGYKKPTLDGSESVMDAEG